MSASASVVYPKPLKLGFSGREDLDEDVFVTDVDKGLAAETRSTSQGTRQPIKSRL